MENYGATAAAARDFNSNVPNLQVFSLADIEAATNGFSVVNKLGEGGYGPVYKVSFYLTFCKTITNMAFSFAGKTYMTTNETLLFDRVYCQMDKK